MWEIRPGFVPEEAEWRIVLGSGAPDSPTIEDHLVVGWVPCAETRGHGDDYEEIDEGIFPAIMEPDTLNHDPVRVRPLTPDFLDERKLIVLQVLPPGKDRHARGLERVYRERRRQRGR